METGKKVDWLFMLVFAVGLIAAVYAVFNVYCVIWDWTDEAIKKELTALYTTIITFAFLGIREKVNKNI